MDQWKYAELERICNIDTASMHNRIKELAGWNVSQPTGGITDNRKGKIL